MPGLVEALQDMGLSLNEAKAYQALLRKSPANGYEISKRSGITRSVVYGVLDRLVEKGYILQVDSEPISYAPLPPEQLLNRYKERCSANLENLEKHLRHISTGVDQDSYILGISGYEDTIRKARQLIRDANAEIALSIWGSDCLPLKEELEAAEKAGKKIVIFCHSKVPFRVGTIHEYGLDEVIVRNVWVNRRIVVVADGRTVLIGDIRNNEKLGIVTTNPIIVQMAAEHLALDILHLAQLRASAGNLSEHIHSGEDYRRIVTDCHAKLSLRSEDFPTQVNP
ncbi:MAG: helix-turn-helix domain-containing protein [Bacillota bacterium]